MDVSLKQIRVGRSGRFGRLGRFWLVAALFMFLLLLAACDDPGQVLAPPDADVTGIQTVLVIPLANESRERDLETTVTMGLVHRLGQVGWYNVLAPERAIDYILEQRIDEDDMHYTSPEWNETARDMALALDADGFILGVITDYDESVTVGAAYLHPNSEETQWLADQATNVTVTLRGKLVNAHTGATVYERTATGHGHVTEARQLNWVIPESPPDTLIPAPHRRDISIAREAAIEDALGKFTADILPRPVTDSEDDRNRDE